MPPIGVQSLRSTDFYLRGSGQATESAAALASRTAVCLKPKMRSVLRRLIDAAAPRIALATGNHLFRQPIFETVQGVTVLATLDVRKCAQVVAGLQAGEFYCKHLYNAQFFDHYLDHVAAMARLACGLGDGLILEFGVASGRTLTAIANSIDV